MSVVGIVSKMAVRPHLPAEYSLPLGEHHIELTPYLGKRISLEFSGKMVCLGCQRAIKKTYQDGYCFPCTQRLARCDLCILKPERCHYHLGTCREPSWGEQHCMIPHIVYLANSSGLKVGITRANHLPTRWLDQGASHALPLIQVSTRRLSGLVEVAFSKKVSDKTNWRQMLKGENVKVNLLYERERLLKELETELAELRSTWGEEAIKLIDNPPLYSFRYPVIEYPTQITSLSWDKTPRIEGQLLGIKGQYLLLDSGVVNVRKHSGYVLEFSSDTN